MPNCVTLSALRRFEKRNRSVLGRSLIFPVYFYFFEKIESGGYEEAVEAHAAEESRAVAEEKLQNELMVREYQIPLHLSHLYS